VTSSYELPMMLVPGPGFSQTPPLPWPWLLAC
jgi:hypothetical protein